MGCYRLARTPDKGIQALLAKRGIRYFSFLQLGNEFRHEADWRVLFRRKLTKVGSQLVEPLFSPDIPQPFCLICSEKRVADCHRGLIADFLEQKGFEIRHIEWGCEAGPIRPPMGQVGHGIGSTFPAFPSGHP